MYLKKNVARRIIFILYLFVYGFSFSQDFYVDDGASISVDAGHALYIKGNLSVHNGATLTLHSNATKSASLIISEGATVSGKITYKRHVNDTDWHIVSAPVSYQDVQTFVSDGNNDIPTSGSKYAVARYKNDNSSGNKWVYHVQYESNEENEEVMGNFNTAKGYAMKRNSPGTYTFTGGTTASDVSIDLDSNGTTHRWHGVGNPFPSFIAANDNANGSYNILRKNTSKLDTIYTALYVLKNDDYEVINSSSTGNDAMLAPGQGFIIKTNSDIVTFTFEKDATSHQDGDVTLKTNSNASSIPTMEIRLSKGDTDKTTTIKYLDNTTLGLDPGYDAGAYQDGTPSFAINTHLVSESDGIDFMLQCLPESALGTVVIPLSVYAQENDELNFSVELSDLPLGFGDEIYIEDRENNTIYNISDSAYQVNLNNAISGIGRFYLHTSPSTLDTDDHEMLDEVKIYTSSRDNLCIVGVENETATIQLYNILGNQVFNSQFIGKGMNDIKLSNLAVGVYIVRLATLKGIVKKKIIIQ